MAAVPSSSGSSSSNDGRSTAFRHRQQKNVHGEDLASSIHVQLEDDELWRIFSSDGIKNEMIITKAGRRMFPVVRVRTVGLDPRAMYNVVLEFAQIDEYKWKYTDGRWHKSGKAEPQPLSSSYVHPDSPNFGEKWMREAISFSKLKFTNKDNAQNWILLNSMHHYQPTVKIYRIDPNEHDAAQILVASVTLSQCQFIAVTSYQNEEVTELKIKHNPFAKGFQEHGSSRLTTTSNHNIAASLPMPTYGGMAHAATPSNQSSDANRFPASPLPSTTNAGISYPPYNYSSIVPSLSPYADQRYYDQNRPVHSDAKLCDSRCCTDPILQPTKRSNQRMQPNFEYRPVSTPFPTASFCPPTPLPPPVLPDNMNFSQCYAPTYANSDNNASSRFCSSTIETPFPELFAGTTREYYTATQPTTSFPTSGQCTSSNIVLQQYPNILMEYAPPPPPQPQTDKNLTFGSGIIPEDCSHYGFNNLNYTINKNIHQQSQYYCLPFVGGSGNTAGVVGKFSTSSVLHERTSSTTRFHPYGAAARAPRFVNNNNKHNAQLDHQICAISQPQQPHIECSSSSSSVPGSSSFYVELDEGSVLAMHAAQSANEEICNGIITANGDANKIHAASSAVMHAVCLNSSTDTDGDDAVHSTTTNTHRSSFDVI